MKKYTLAAIMAAMLAALTLTSCHTPTGQGAGFGAATGAIIGGATTGNVRGAAIGAGIGAAAGALVGAAVEAEGGYYGGQPVDAYPYGRVGGGGPGVVRSPYPPHGLVDVRGIPRGALVRDPHSGRVFRRP